MKLSDIPFSPKHTEEEMSIARGLLSELVKERSGTANFAIVFEGGGHHKYFSQACHSQIATKKELPPSIVVTEGCGWNRRGDKNNVPRDTARVYVDYLVNVFYAGRYVLNRDVDECLDKGFIVSADGPAPILQNLFIASRNLYEINTGAFVQFEELINKGIDPNLAYNCCFPTTAGYSGRVYGTDTPIPMDHVAGQYSGHRPHMMLDIKSLRNFINGEFGTASNVGALAVKPGLSPYRTSQSYYGGSGIFQERGHPLTTIPSALGVKEFRDVLAGYRKGTASVELYRPPNPFKSAPKTLVGAGQISNKELYDVLVPFLDTYYKEERKALQQAVSNAQEEENADAVRAAAA